MNESHLGQNDYWNYWNNRLNSQYTCESQLYECNEYDFVIIKYKRQRVKLFLTLWDLIIIDEECTMEWLAIAKIIKEMD